VVERNGKLYCRRHDPEAVAAKKVARDAGFQVEEERRDRLEAEAQRRCQALGMGDSYYRHGYGSQIGGPTGGIVLTAAEADELIARLELAPVGDQDLPGGGARP
jgi:hypothetical protein